jgi:DNA polymerase I
MAACRDWRDLPFREIWVVDSEYYPGAGKANGGRDGDAITPLCVVAHEMRSGRVVRLWQDEFGPFPPYRLDADALIINFFGTAEFGTHIALGWAKPICALDVYVEFRHFVNDGRIKSGDREKGFYGLGGALRYFCEDEIDVTHKKDMRERILQGPPFTHQERHDILDYCEDDVRALTRLVPHIIPTIRSLKHAMFRAEFVGVTAGQEHRGIPFDLPLHERILHGWDGMRLGLVTELDAPFGIYEIIDGAPHWRRQRFVDYVQRNRMTWLTHADGSLDESDKAFGAMEGKYPHIAPLRELRYSLSKLRLNDLQVGSDGRNRTLLGPYGTKTGRNAPSNSRYAFGPATWIRFLIKPPPGRVLIHRDFCQQEPRIAAVQSGDMALLEACESGDVYLGIADQLGFLSESMSAPERKGVRTLFKTVVIGIQYAMGAHALAQRTGISLSEAGEILARLRARFHVFEAYVQQAVDHADLRLEIGTPFGWYMQCPSGINSRTVRNFPIQSSGAEVLHVACILAERRGIEVVAPVHDAIMAEAPIDRAEEVSAALDRCMRDASAIVLRGYELPTDVQLIGEGQEHQRYYDDRGEAMWNTVMKLVNKLERGRSAQ